MTDVTIEAETIIKVGANSPVQAVATSISRCITDSHKYPVVRAIGHGAVGQAYKALAIARGYLAPRGIDLAIVPGFETIESDTGQELTAMVARTFAR